MLKLSFSCELKVALCRCRWRLAFVHGRVSFRASCDVKVKDCTEIRPCVCCSVFFAEFIAPFIGVSFLVLLFGLM